MTKRTLNIINILVFTLISTFGVTVAHAGFGPGYTSGWDAAHDGLKGFMHGYNAPTTAYTPGTTLTVRAHIDNPSDNTITVSNRPIYVMINRVIESPTGNSVGNAHTPISEGTLFSNNVSGDSQSLISSTFVQNITLAPGQSTEVAFSFTPTQMGYYQVDFADQDFSGGFTPGRILAAGFIRVYESPDGGNNDNNNNDDNSTSDNGGNESVFASILGATGTGGQVLGITTPQTSESTTPTNPQGQVLAAETTDCTASKSNWFIILLLEAVALAILFVVAKFGKLSYRTYRILVAVITGLVLIIAYIRPCTCTDMWLCQYKYLIALVEGIIAFASSKIVK